MRLLPPELLALPRQLAINFHDGPLPRYAGLNATCWALLNGESEHAVTWHVIEDKADTGDILVQQAFPIAADDTAFTLNARCFAFGTQSFGELCNQLANGTATGRAQDLTRRSYFAARIGRHRLRATGAGGVPVGASVRSRWLPESDCRRQSARQERRVRS